MKQQPNLKTTLGAFIRQEERARLLQKPNFLLCFGKDFRTPGRGDNFQDSGSILETADDTIRIGEMALVRCRERLEVVLGRPKFNLFYLAFDFPHGDS